MRIQVNDVRLFFDVDGPKLVPDGAILRDRPTLLLLHGGPGFDHSLFKPQFSELTDIAQVIYLDLRGNGRSDHGSRDRWTLQQWAEDVRVFCEVLEIERPIVLGVSFGGFVAMTYASQYPEHPSKLILVSTAARYRRDRILNTFERLGGLTAREAARQFLENPTPETTEGYRQICMPLYRRQPQDPNIAKRVIQNPELTLAFFVGEQQTYNLVPELPKIQCSTLVMAGKDDPIIPIEDVEETVEALSSNPVKFVSFSNCGHGIFPDDPQAGFKVLRQFLMEA
jgi:proline iminopeptidase